MGDNPHLKGDKLRFPVPEEGYSSVHDMDDFEAEWRRVMRVAAYNRRKLWSDTMSMPGSQPLAIVHWGAIGLFQRPTPRIPALTYLKPHDPKINKFGSLATVPNSGFANMFTDEWQLVQADMDQKLNIVRASYANKH